MPLVEVFTREQLSDETRTKLAEELSNTIMTVEVGGPTESAKMIDWMWFHTMPADSWAVGGRFDDTYVKGRKMALARIIAPQGLMNTELKRSILLVNLLFSLPPPRRWASCAYKQLNLPARNESHPLTFS